jgi:hypothetical protein
MGKNKKIGKPKKNQTKLVLVSILAESANPMAATVEFGLLGLPGSDLFIEMPGDDGDSLYIRAFRTPKPLPGCRAVVDDMSRPESTMVAAFHGTDCPQSRHLNRHRGNAWSFGTMPDCTGALERDPVPADRFRFSMEGM